MEEEQMQTQTPVEPVVESPPEDPARQALRLHIRSLEQQAQALRRSVPDFDLRRELKNPAFARLTAPGGVSLADAYFATHRRELQQAAVQAAAQGIARSIQADRRRPQENGGQAPALTGLDYRKAGKEQRQALKSAIRAAAARGEKLYPGKTY